MISKPPQLGNKSFRQWIIEFLGYFERVRFELAKVRTVWFPAQSTSVHGDHPGEQITATNSAFISAIIPREVSEIREAVIRFIPSGTGTIDWTANLSSGDAGEDEADNTATMTANGLSVTDDQISEIDVTQLFSSVDKNDQVGLEFVLDAATTTTDVYVLGLYFKFR